MKKISVYVMMIFIVMWLLGVLAGCKPANNNGNGNGNGNGDEGQFYVAVNGSDNNDGSKDTPWLTVQHGLDNIQPGQTLNIGAGTYSETLYLDHSGSAGKKIYIKGHAAADTILDGTNSTRDLFFIENAGYIHITGLTMRKAPRAALRLSYADHVEILACVFDGNGRWGVFTDFSDDTLVENCTASGSAAEHGIYISNSSDNAVIRHNTVHHNYASGIQVNADPSMGGDGISSGCLIENNIVYENGKGGGAAINLASVRDSIIQNNMIYHNYAGGIAAWDDGQGNEWGSKNLTIIHNTIYFRPGEGRWALSLKNGSSGAHIYNNILAGGKQGGFEFTGECLTNIESDYNVYYSAASNVVVCEEDGPTYTLTQWQGIGNDPHAQIAAPANLFNDPGNSDFHLKNASPALDTATNRGLTYDFESDTRPQGPAPDCGADEKTAASTALAAETANR